MELAGGSYHIEVSAPGYRTDSQWVKLAAGEDKRHAARLRLAPVAPPEPKVVAVAAPARPQASSVAAPARPSPPVAVAPAPQAAKAGNKYVNLLRSGNPRNKADAGKLIVREGIKDTAVLDVAEAELLKGYLSSGDDRAAVDAMAWLCKALGASGNGKYRATLQTVAAKAPHSKLQKHARQSLEQLR
jgi:hypothetical protein